jgi:hypothetical protein
MCYFYSALDQGRVGGLRKPIGERKSKRWLLRSRGAALKVKQVNARRGHLSAYVTLYLRALPLADSTWYVNYPLNPRYLPF